MICRDLWVADARVLGTDHRVRLDHAGCVPQVHALGQASRDHPGRPVHAHGGGCGEGGRHHVGRRGLRRLAAQVRPRPGRALRRRLVVGEIRQRQLPAHQRNHHGSGRVRYPQSPPDLGEVLLHGRFGEPEAGCHLGRTEALGREPENLAMTFREHHREDGSVPGRLTSPPRAVPMSPGSIGRRGRAVSAPRSRVRPEGPPGVRMRGIPGGAGRLFRTWPS